MSHHRKYLIRIFALFILMSALWGASTGWAQFESSLRGTYHLGYSRSCSNAATPIASPPPGNPDIQSFTGGVLIDLRGIATYNGDGTGSFTGTQIVNGGGPGFSGQVLSDGSNEFIIRQSQITNCPITYAVGNDGAVSQSWGPCTLTILAGAGAVTADLGATYQTLDGATASLTNVRIEGQLTLDGTVIPLMSTTTGENPASLPLTSEVAADVETLTWLTGPLASTSPTIRLCKGVGMATSNR